MSFEIPHYIATIIPYFPGKPIEEAKRELKLDKVIKLASNESPLGPSPKAMAAIRKNLKGMHRYPDAGAYYLKSKLSSQLKVGMDQIICGNGSNEVIDMSVRTFTQPGDQIVTSQAAFIAYRICAQIHGVETLEAPMMPDYRFDLKKMLELAKKNPRVKIVFIANPNNPTGTYVGDQELRAFLDEIQNVHSGSILVALDDAYLGYTTAKDFPDAWKLQQKYPNLLVIRTFSKIYGMGGFRLGYGFGSKEIIHSMEKVRQPFNVNALSQTAGEAALSDHEHVKRSIQINREGMKFWEKNLEQREIPYWKSQANFILIDVHQAFHRSGGEVYQDCLRQGIIFRPVMNYGLPHALRISVGTMQENKKAWKVLSGLLPKSGQ